MKVSEIIKLLKREKCVLIAHGKEHDKWYSPVTGRTFCVPRHRNKELPTGTAHNILKDAGIKE